MKMSKKKAFAQRLVGYGEDKRKLEHFFKSDFVCEKKGWRNYSRLLRLASAKLTKSNSKFGSLIDV